jgi:fatty-acyl-CoA synthase
MLATRLFEVGAALDLIARERIDEWCGFPTHTAALGDHPDWPTADLSSITRVQGNNEFDGRLNTGPDTGWNHIVAYNISETCTSVVSHLSITPTADQHRSAGKLLPDIDLRITDVDDGRTLKSGAEGEILCAAEQ